jgi:DNA-directed RNA polymerase subunit M/transcription elongation factor TFIIS
MPKVQQDVFFLMHRYEALGAIGAFCPKCGASMLYWENARALHCVYCGQTFNIHNTDYVERWLMGLKKKLEILPVQIEEAEKQAMSQDPTLATTGKKQLRLLQKIQKELPQIIKNGI